MRAIPLTPDTEARARRLVLIRGAGEGAEEGLSAWNDSATIWKGLRADLLSLIAI